MQDGEWRMEEDRIWKMDDGVSEMRMEEGAVADTHLRADEMRENL